MASGKNLPPNWSQNLDILANLARQTRLGILTDVDGTISPIVDVPREARVGERHRGLLAALAEKVSLVAAISGRQASDIARRIDLPKLIYIGNHGFERWEDDQVRPTFDLDLFQPSLLQAGQTIETHLWPGMWVEDKGATLTVHYRQARDPAAAEAALQPLIQAIAASHNLHFFKGRMVFELRPPVACHKGTAVEQLAAEFKLDGALYIGDDVTDIDALRAVKMMHQNQRLVGVAVGVFSPDIDLELASTADCLASGVDDVADLFAWLLKAVSAS